MNATWKDRIFEQIDRDIAGHQSEIKRLMERRELLKTIDAATLVQLADLHDYAKERQVK